jgi:tricorn protease
MEMHPRPVDFPVVRPVGESYAGRDSQLDAAVKELLSELDERKKR